MDHLLLLFSALAETYGRLRLSDKVRALACSLVRALLHAADRVLTACAQRLRVCTRAVAVAQRARPESPTFAWFLAQMGAVMGEGGHVQQQVALLEQAIAVISGAIDSAKAADPVMAWRAQKLQMLASAGEAYRRLGAKDSCMRAMKVRRVRCAAAS